MKRFQKGLIWSICVLAFLGVKNEIQCLKLSGFNLRFPVELQVGDCDVMQAACNKYKCTSAIIFSLKLFSCVKV